MMNSSKKNIVFFQQSISLEDGGVPRVSDVISKELMSRGYKCYFVYYQNDNPNYSSTSKLKVDFNKSNKFNEEAVLRFIEENSINVVVCQNTYSRFFIKIYHKLRFSNPNLLVLTFLHASPDYWTKSFQFKKEKSAYDLVKAVSKNLLKRIVYPVYNPYVTTTSALYHVSDKFILLSDTFYASFQDLYLGNNKPQKLITIPNPLTFEASTTSDLQQDKQKIVLIVSRLEEGQKRISKALTAWHKLQNEQNDWKLCIVGSGPDEAYYQKMVEEKRIKNVVFEGYKTNVNEYYKKASVFLLTSIWEGLPMSLLEAQQHGTVPIVFNNFSAVNDMIINGENGFIIQNNCVDDFSKALLRLMKEDSLRTKLAKSAQLSSRRFQLPNIIEKWEEVLRHVQISQ